jgi:hypothetical protein
VVAPRRRDARADLEGALAPERVTGTGGLGLCVWDAAGLRHGRRVPFDASCAGGCWRDGRVVRFRTTEPPVAVQLSSGQACWQTVFADVQRNGPRSLRATLR